MFNDWLEEMLRRQEPPPVTEAAALKQFISSTVSALEAINARKWDKARMALDSAKAAQKTLLDIRSK